MKVILFTLLDSYQNLLEKLNTSETLSKKDILEILLTRDALNKALSNRVKPSSYTILKIEDLDGKLKHNADKLTQFINLAEYRNNFPKPPNTWWWYLDIYAQEKARKSHPWNHFDWFLRLVRSISLIGNIALSLTELLIINC